MFTVWLVGLVLACARTAWTFFGATRISVSSDELVVSHCFLDTPLFVSAPIKLSTVKDAFIEERKFEFKGTKSHLWGLIVRLDDGSTHRLASFRSGREATEFLRSFAR